MRGLLLVPEGPPLDLLLCRLAEASGLRLEGWAPRWVRVAARARDRVDPGGSPLLRCGRWGAPPAWGEEEAVDGALELLLPPGNPLVRLARTVWPADTWPCARACALRAAAGPAGSARLPIQMRPADHPRALLTWLPPPPA